MQRSGQGAIEERLPVGCVPRPQRSRDGDRRDPRAIGGDGDGRHRAGRLTTQRAHGLPRGRIPESHGLILAATDGELPIGRRRHGPHGLRMPRQLPRRDEREVPALERAVGSGRPERRLLALMGECRNPAAVRADGSGGSPIGSREDRDVASLVTRRDLLVVGRHGEGLHGCRVRADRAHGLTRRGPHPHRRVVGGRREPLPRVGRHEGAHSSRMTLDGRRWRGEEPTPHRAILAGRDHALAVRHERDAEHRACMSHDRSAIRTVANLLEPRGPVHAAEGHERAVGRRGDRVDQGDVVGGPRQFPDEFE